LISEDKIRTHSQRSILTKSVGIDLFVQPDIIQQRLREGDRLILCSDGVWSVIEDDELAQVACRPCSMDELSQNLIDLALQHNTDDNASVVVFHLHKLHPASAIDDSAEEESTGWLKKLRKLVS
jgi:protein phosphatase